MTQNPQILHHVPLQLNLSMFTQKTNEKHTLSALTIIVKMGATIGCNTIGNRPILLNADK